MPSGEIGGGNGPAAGALIGLMRGGCGCGCGYGAGENQQPAAAVAAAVAASS
jgi:hypothetical protein